MDAADVDVLASLSCNAGAGENSLSLLYPQVFDVSGAGSQEANGRYILAGMKNDRPYYEKENENKSGYQLKILGLGGSQKTALWYFQTSVPLLSSYNGWFISKQASSIMMSAHDDYYAAFTDSPLPPSTGWSLIGKGMFAGPTVGCGIDPPPLRVESVDINTIGSPVALSASHVRSFEPSVEQMFPRYIVVEGAGTANANGIYVFRETHEANPEYIKHGGTEAIWYFSECPVNHSSGGLVSYNGWYLSVAARTSRYSAAYDIYCAYTNDSSSIPLASDKWVVPRVAAGLSNGCGKIPIPTIRAASHQEVVAYLAEIDQDHADLDDVPQKVIIVAISLPDGRSVNLNVSELSTVEDLLLRLDALYPETPIYSISLKHGNEVLSTRSDLLVQHCRLMHRDVILVQKRHKSLRSPHIDAPKAVAIIGAGPVGLWTALQLKIWLPSWEVTVYEKREKYSRSHALRIDPVAFSEMPQWTPDLPPGAAALKLFSEKWVPRTRTSDVESELRQQCIFAGVKLIYGSDCSITRLLAADTRPDIIIGCDGASGLSRRELHNLQQNSSQTVSDLRHHKRMGSLLQVKFDATGKVNRSQGKLGTFIRNLPADKEFFNILPGNFDRERCCTPITIFAFMNDLLSDKLRSDHPPSTETHREEMAKVEDATEDAGDPEHSPEEAEESDQSLIAGTAAEAEHNHREEFNIDDHPIMKSDLMHVLDRVCPGGIKEGTLKINILPVEYKVARTVAYCYEGVSIFLAGDAAMGLPLEKGLNFGWRISSRLCRYIAFCNNAPEAISAYEGYFSHASTSALVSVNATFSRYANDAYAASLVRSMLKPLSGVRIMIKQTQVSKQRAKK